jgi:polyhydroxybutyrate depolymerase
MRKAMIWMVIGLYFLACENEEGSLNEDIFIGKNHFTTLVDGDERAYIVHVPIAYNKNTKTPVVLMLHGASGTGEATYIGSGWKELGEDEIFLSVFPTAWDYCYIRSNGEVYDTTRWNSLPGIFTFCSNENPKDDVKFLRQIISELHSRFNVDPARIYMVGFSSGAQMAFRCAVEMSDLLAAVVESGSSHPVVTVLTPRRNIPISLELGNKDPNWFENGLYPPLNLFDTLLMHYPLFEKIIYTHVHTFDYNTNYTLVEKGNTAITATFNSKENSKDREFNFTLIDGLDHSYPNTVNHQIYGAREHWLWMKKYKTPQ